MKRDFVVALSEVFDYHICCYGGLWTGFWNTLANALEELKDGEEFTVKLHFKRNGDKITIFPSKMRPLEVCERPISVTLDGEIILSERRAREKEKLTN